MEKFEGNGAECMAEFLRRGCVGVVSDKNSQLAYMTQGKWEAPDNYYWGIVWLIRSCTYTPPEPVWQKCTAGNALDALIKKKHAQVFPDTSTDWYDLDLDYEGWGINTDTTQYRKEV